jgi:hypothetical protein
MASPRTCNKRGNNMRQDWDACTNGMIMEFKDMTQAEAFAVAVREQFNLDSRVFANSVDAERVHLFPFQQHAPVVHVDPPTMVNSIFLPLIIDPSKKIRKKSIEENHRLHRPHRPVAVADGFGNPHIFQKISSLSNVRYLPSPAAAYPPAHFTSSRSRRAFSLMLEPQ